MFPLTQQVPAHVSEGGDEDEDDGGEGQGANSKKLLRLVFRPDHRSQMHLHRRSQGA